MQTRKWSNDRNAVNNCEVTVLDENCTFVLLGAQISNETQKIDVKSPFCLSFPIPHSRSLFF